MKRTRIAPVLLLALAAACAYASTPSWTGGVLRPAADTPVEFVSEDGTRPENACRNPLVDPRDQTRIRLMRSADVGGRQRGDYEVPAGRYGVGTDELLRIDCASGQALGIVPN
ncbi:MAG TPA: hypothetical protein VFZ69_05440 [Longimicrobiales bacterium]